MPDHHRIDLTPPDLAPHRASSTGVDYVHVLDSGKPGATVMAQALTHGNEICGAIALDWLLRERFAPERGRVILAFANIEAFRRFDYDDPDRSRYVDEDYNRVWSDEAHASSRDSVELRRARVLRPFVDGADFVLGDRDGTTCAPGFTDFVRARLVEMGYEVKVNDPYKGVELVRAYSSPKDGRHSLQVEIAKRLYMDEGTLERNGGFARLQSDLRDLLVSLKEYVRA